MTSPSSSTERWWQRAIPALLALGCAGLGIWSLAMGFKEAGGALVGLAVREVPAVIRGAGRAKTKDKEA